MVDAEEAHTLVERGRQPQPGVGRQGDLAALGHPIYDDGGEWANLVDEEARAAELAQARLAAEVEPSASSRAPTLSEVERAAALACTVCNGGGMRAQFTEQQMHGRGIALHALRYEHSEGLWRYEVPLPDWAEGLVAADRVLA